METFLGLLGVALFVVAILALSALVTLAVTKLTPARKRDEQQPQQTE
jgi:hypothetical protein